MVVRWAPAFCACMAFASAARAIVVEACSEVGAVPVPAPVPAGSPAILFTPNLNATRFGLTWRDAEGALVEWTSREAWGKSFYMVPEVPVEPGQHELTYEDDCPFVEESPVQLSVHFQAHPPPPERLGILHASYDPYCPGASRNGVAPDYPPPVTIWLEADPALVPYAPLLRTTLRDETGTIQAGSSGVPTLSFKRSVLCASQSPSVPEGTYRVTASGELLGYPPLEPATVEVVLECPVCPGTDMAGPPEADAGGDEEGEPEGVRSSDAGCSIASGSRRTGAAWWFAPAGLVAMRLRRRTRVTHSH